MTVTRQIGRAAALALALGAVTLTVYLTGGTSRVFPHLFYLPIVAGAFWFGWRGGLLTGVVSGFLCGPIMPLDTAAGIAQTTPSWLVRTVFFVVAGSFVGMLAEALRRRVREIAAFNEQAIHAFVRAIDAKSPYTALHSEKVAEYAVAVVQQLGGNKDEQEQVRWAGLLHDIGKLMVPESVLNKPGPLSDAEWEIMKRHVEASVRILSDLRSFERYLVPIAQHHERVDGTGYPNGLHAADISRGGRVLAVADAFDAMTSDRPYRNGLSEDEALRRLRAGAGSHFDPEVVEALARAVFTRESLVEDALDTIEDTERARDAQLGAV